MAKNTCRQKFLAAIEVDAACILGPTSLGGGCGILLFSLCSLMKFSLCSQWVPMYFQHVPNSSLLYPIFFALCFYSCNIYNQPKGGDYDISNLGQPKVDFFLIYWGDGSDKDAHHKRKEIELSEVPVTN
jgi:hypothetical protein